MMIQMLMGGVSIITVSISGAPALGLRSGAGVATTNSVTASTSDGVAPFTYEWILISGDVFTVNSPTAATTTFSKSVTLGDSFAATYRCTITDAAGAKGSADINVSVTEVS